MKTKCDCLNPVLSFMMKQCFFSQINLTNNNAKQRFHICFRWGSQIFKLLKATVYKSFLGGSVSLQRNKLKAIIESKL